MSIQLIPFLTGELFVVWLVWDEPDRQLTHVRGRNWKAFDDGDNNDDNDDDNEDKNEDKVKSTQVIKIKSI